MCNEDNEPMARIFLKMKKITLFLIFALLGSCDFFPKKETQHIQSAELEFHYQKQSKTVGDCETDAACFKVVLEKIVFDKGYEQESLAALNAFIDSLFFADENKRSLEDLVDLYVSEYEELLAQMPAYNLPWAVSRSIVLEESLPGMITLKYYDYNFRGGASEFENTLFFHFDRHDLAPVDLMQFINLEYEEAFREYVKFELEKNLKLNDGETLESLGFEMENALPVLPDNFSINSNEITFYFNKNEVSPVYAQNFELTFFLSDLEPWLNTAFLFHVRQRVS